MHKNPIVFNITFKIGKEISEEWLKQMQVNYLPPCTDGQIIVGSQINLIHLSQKEEDNDLTYAVQFTYLNESMFSIHKLTTMQKFLSLVDQDYRGQYVYFTTKMERLYYNSYINK